MGSQSSLPERPDGSDRSPSPLSGIGDGFDGLPRMSSTMPNFAGDDMDLPDGLPRYSTQPKLGKKKKRKKRKSRTENTSPTSANQYGDPQDDGITRGDEEPLKFERTSFNARQEGESGYGVKAEALDDNQTKAEPGNADAELESPSRSRKGRRSRASQAQAPGDELDQLPNGPPVSSPELDRAQIGGAAISSPSGPTSSRKKQKKDKRIWPKDKALDLPEDPIAGSDEEHIIPSSAPRKRLSIEGNDGGSSRKKNKRGPRSGSIDPVEEFESAQNIGTSGHEDVIENTQGGNASAGQDSVNQEHVTTPTRGTVPPTTNGAAHYIDDDDVRENGERGTRVSPSELGDGEIQHETGQPDADLDEDAMDVDEQPAAREEDRDMQGSNGDDESIRSGGEAHEEASAIGAQASQSNGRVGLPADETDNVSEADHNMAAQEISDAQQQTDDDHDMLNPSSDGEDGPNKDSFSNASEAIEDIDGSEASSVSGVQEIVQQTIKSAESRKKATKSPGKANKVLQAAESAEVSADRQLSEPDQADLTANGQHPPDRTDMENGTNQESGEEEARMNGAQSEASSIVGDPSTPNGPHAMHSPSTLGSKKTRRYAKRQPKPSFFAREAESNARAFAELPSNEIETSAGKSRAKRRLPIHVEVEAGPSSSASNKKAKKGKSAKDSNTEGQGLVLNGLGGYRRGPLMPSEIAQVTEAIEQFQSERRMEQYALNVMIHENPKHGRPLHRELWQRVQNACPTRPRKKLINWSRLQFHNFVGRGRWTAEQDEELRQMVKIHGKKWSVIGGLINRHPNDARDRWRNYLVCSDNWKTNMWSEEESTKFISIVSESLRVAQNMREEDPHNESLRVLSNEQLIDWGFVSESMAFTRSRLQCQEKWKRIRESGKLDKNLASLLPSESSSRKRKTPKKPRKVSSGDDQVSDAEETATPNVLTSPSTTKRKGKGKAVLQLPSVDKEAADGSDSDVVPESEPEEEPDHDGDSSRANRNEDSDRQDRSPSPDQEGPQEEDQEHEHAPGSEHQGSERGRDEREVSVDLSMNVDADEQQDEHVRSPGGKSGKGKEKLKRMGKGDKGKVDTPRTAGKLRESRKRSRADRSPETIRLARRSKKAKRDPVPAPEDASDISSSMDDMEDIPARVRVSSEGGDE
ncbi:hypothetical protein QBC33DRAFT_537974 [Phialemonium atrogriseum]|uniref:DNA-binding protein REB1 n=1 Tax=Phialemonium atrogriseum TaxID=1093897 RepID=A0AAJ0C251_9PEZI|nr:uncharacterized protein QBC33DRAFT_537974 [Phialemonium atrogriseum]KAK1767317.1 hypothetical protein QBC33DRAFT_537974 [Phialemonium atrogriseum]